MAQETTVLTAKDPHYSEVINNLHDQLELFNKATASNVLQNRNPQKH